MESSEGPTNEIRHTIQKHLEDFERCLTGELTKKLTERDRIYSHERNGYLQEIDALRVKAARTEELESENKKLQTELEDARQRQRERSSFDGDGVTDAERSGCSFKGEAKTENLTVDIEEYNRLKKDFMKLESEYGRLVWARETLETKVRQQKGAIRQWKEYRKNWILKHPNRRLSNLRPSSANPGLVTVTEHHRSSSAPAPPALPEGLTPSSSFISKSPSAYRNEPPDQEDERHRYNRLSEHHSEDQGSQPNEINILQAEHGTANASGSGGTTEASPESEKHREPKPIKPKPDTGGSSPIVVFERTLKRRHSAKASVHNIHVHEDDQALMTIPPKDEQSSSPIQALPLIRSDGPHDSLDLDDVGGRLDTPRKRQRMEQERLRSSKLAPLMAVQGEDMLDDMTADQALRHHDEQEPEFEGEQDNEASKSIGIRRTLPGEMAEEQKKARRYERLARQTAHNDRIYQRLDVAEKRDPVLDPPRSSSPITDESAQQPRTPNIQREIGQRKPDLASPILQPRDANASVLPRTGDPFANRKRPCPPSRRDRGAAHVPEIAEDGERPPSNNDMLKSKNKSKDDETNTRSPSNKESKAPPTHHRLGALLTKPSPEKWPLIPDEPIDAVFSDTTWTKTPIPRSFYSDRSKAPATPRSLPAKRIEHKKGLGNESRSADFEPIDATIDRYSKSAQAVSKRTKDVPAPRKPSPKDYPQARPEHEPLRARPVHRLNLQDFKFNPAHSSFAYHETVRKHDEKKSLSGCTDRHCQRCKSLRQYVIDSGYKTAQRPGESDADADWRLMQDYLGDNRRQLRGMSVKEREDLLLEAKVKEFANRFGCHRMAFAGTREPPGLWDVDFPTTQEEAANRAAADVMEREKVQERYWEATRPGGKWMFADE